MYKREKRSWMKHLDFTIMDIILLQVAFLLSYAIRFPVMWAYSEEIYWRLAVVTILIQVCIIFFTEPYKNILRRDKVQELKAVIGQSTMVFLGVILFMYATKQSVLYSRQMLFGFWGIAMFFSYIGHILLKIWVRRQLSAEKNCSVMLLITTNDMVEQCIINFEETLYRSFKIKGIVVLDKDRQGDVIRQVPVVANADNYMDYVRTNVVDEVFINHDNIQISESLAEKLLEMGVVVHFKLAHEMNLMPNRVVEKCGPYMVMTSSMCIASPRQIFVKRCMDIAGGLVGLLITGVAYVIFAPMIKKQSPGPIFFAQTRVGKNGRPFKIYKFRSMYMDAEERKKELMEQNEMQGFMFKMEDDPRIFPIGKVMRKFSIDELPQFWNVLKGEMSLVGTRPPTMDEFEQYEAHHRARLGNKPGLTGMWQVSGRSKITDFEEVVGLDTYYISNWNLALDVRILLKTVKVVLLGRGAE